MSPTLLTDSPHVLRPRTTAGVGFGLAPTRKAAGVWAAYLTLGRTQWASPDEIEVGQRAQFRVLLAHAIAHVPHYRELFMSHGITANDVCTMEDVRRLPMLDRRTCQAAGLRMRAGELPAGTEPTAKSSTSGTSGIPVQVLQTDVVERWWYALHLRDLEWAGIDPRRGTAVIRAFREAGERRPPMMQGVSRPSWEALDPYVETGPLHAMDVNCDPRVQLAWLRRVAASHVITYASNLAALTAVASGSGDGVPGLRSFHTTAEMLPPRVRRRAEEVFGAPVTNVYSSAEAGYIATDCPDVRGAYHVHAENVLLEVLDDAGRPCGPGDTGRVVLTTLQNFLAPFIRYDIGDEAEVGAPCECGRGLPTLARVTGKRHLTLVLPDGSLKNSGDLLKSVPGVGGLHQYQVVLRRDGGVAINVVSDGTFGEAQHDRLVAIFRDYFESPIPVAVVTMDRLPLTAAGKVLDLVDEREDPRTV